MPRHATNPWLILVLVCFAQFMVVLDATVVNVALPSIQKDLGMTEAYHAAQGVSRDAQQLRG